MNLGLIIHNKNNEYTECKLYISFWKNKQTIGTNGIPNGWTVEKYAE